MTKSIQMSMFVDVIKYSNIKFNLINFSSIIIYVICTMSVSDDVKVPLAICSVSNKEKGPVTLLTNQEPAVIYVTFTITLSCK